MIEEARVSVRTADRFAPFGTTIFTEMTLLANRHGAVNLAQGFPDFDGPEFVRRLAAEAAFPGAGRPGMNQYARMFGLPALNQAIAQWWLDQTGRSVDPDTMVTVTSGCTEALAAAMLGLMNPGDEVVLFEPYYDSYRACVAMAGGVARFVTLRPDPERGVEGGFYFDERELRAAFTKRTRAVLVNTPHNPTGKVFTREELDLIAGLCIEHDAVAITDEVYECLTYDEGVRHERLATFGEDGGAGSMQPRTLTLSSLGKTFSLTGWKVGWAIGPAELTKAVRAAHQFLTFATCTPMQVGAAAALTLPEGRRAIGELVSDLRESRTLLGDALRSLGFGVAPAQGAYFLMADFSRAGCAGGRCKGIGSDVEFCRMLPEQAGVAAIPPSAFYEHKDEARHLARFAFCKRRQTLEEAVRRLRRWAGA